LYIWTKTVNINSWIWSQEQNSSLHVCERKGVCVTCVCMGWASIFFYMKLLAQLLLFSVYYTWFVLHYEVWSNNFRSEFFSLYSPHLAATPCCPLQNSSFGTWYSKFSESAILQSIYGKSSVLNSVSEVNSFSLFVMMSLNFFLLSNNFSFEKKQHWGRVEANSHVVFGHKFLHSGQEHCQDRRSIYSVSIFMMSSPHIFPQIYIETLLHSISLRDEPLMQWYKVRTHKKQILISELKKELKYWSSAHCFLQKTCFWYITGFYSSSFSLLSYFEKKTE
jgi:hypothetical protein